jgi:lipid-A-disaccharide synthase
MASRRPIALVAGEASGDQLGAGLIAAAKRLQPDLRFVGVAGPAMRAAGCEAWHGTEELSVMGLAEVLRHLPRLARVRHRLLTRLLADPPAVFVGIDAPDFNLRLAPRLRAAGIPTVQYVCPQVWAWRSGRLALLARACDEVLCLLPFEVALLEKAGVRARFVGHPFADQIPAQSDPLAARARLGLGAGPLVGLLPGSRHAEVVRLGPAFLQAALAVRREWPGIDFALSVATPALRPLLESQRAACTPGLDVRLLDGQARELMTAADGLLVASGTATLETMLVNRPMVVAYRLAPVTYWLARLLNLVEVRHFALPNLLADEPLVPELLQGEVKADRLAGELLALLRSAPRRAHLHQSFSTIGDRLRRGASERAAHAVLELAGART